MIRRSTASHVLFLVCLATVHYGLTRTSAHRCAPPRDFTKGDGLKVAQLPPRVITGYLSARGWAVKEFIFMAYASWLALTDGYPGRLDLAIAGVPEAASTIAQICNVVKPGDTPESVRRTASDCYFLPYAERDHEQYGYHGINQFAFVLDDRIAKWLKTYTYVMKTDLDVFFLPRFLDLVPPAAGNEKHETELPVIFGQQFYVLVNITRDNILATSRHFGYRHQGKHNVGMCFTGTYKQHRMTARLTLKVLQYMLEKTFPQKPGGGPAQSLRDGWPEWSVYLSVMYAQEVAVNHLFDNLTIDARFDAHSDILTPTDDILHVHTQHGAERFDKREFLKYFYSDIDLDKLNPKVTRDCITLLAVGTYRATNPNWKADDIERRKITTWVDDRVDL